MERESLENIDTFELVKRGAPFIEGVAQAFESRNYLVMFTALVTTLFAVLFFWLGIIGGIVMLVVVKFNMSGKVLNAIADVTEADIRFEGPTLFVGDILIKNVGLEIREKSSSKRQLVQLSPQKIKIALSLCPISGSGKRCYTM